MSCASTASRATARRCLQFRQGRRRRFADAAAAAAAASASGPPTPPPSLALEAARLVATAGLQRGLRTAASAAAAAAAAAEASNNNNNTSLEGRLLPAHLVAAPAGGGGNGAASPFLLRLMEQRYGLGGSTSNENQQKTITVITPHDVDAIFDALQARGCEDGDPYWARVWPSAVALAECVLARPELVKGKRVADVGAGLGVAGLAAALAGAREVVLLDREPLALECARLSAEATGRGGAFRVARPDGGEAIAVVADDSPLRPLASIHEVLGDDGVATTPDQPRSTTTTVRADPFDWHERPLPPRLRKAFDVVLACDVLYERDAVEPLAEVVPLLMANGARLLLADPPARTAENRKRFLAQLAEGRGSGAGAGGSRFAVDEAARVECAPRQLDRELLGGEQEGKAVPVQLLHLRAVDGNDTVGLKLGAF